jgi:hypothetical protein
MRFLVVLLCSVFLLLRLAAQSDGDYRSIRSGNWSDASLWQKRNNGVWATATAAPIASDNVFIQQGHRVTVDQAGLACRDLHLHTGATLAIGQQKLDLHGKLRAYTGTAVTTNADMVTSNSASPGARTITAGVDGRLRVVGASRTLLAAGEWGNAGLTDSGRIEFAINPADTVVCFAAIKARVFYFTSGAVNMRNNRLSADGGVAASGDVFITGGTLRSDQSATNQVITRTSSNRCDTVYIGPNGKLMLFGASPRIECSFFINEGQVIFARNGSQNLLSHSADQLAMDPQQYHRLIITAPGTKTMRHSISVHGFVQLADGVTLATDTCALRLKANPISTAYIAPLGTANITYGSTGKIIVEKYFSGGGRADQFPSKRAFRFIGHPFRHSIGLSELNGAGEMAITGQGGTSNGFDASGTNNPSAFRYDPAAVINATPEGLQNGWQAFTHTNGQNNNAWRVGQGIKVFYRGAKEQGMDGSLGYTVQPSIVAMEGRVNTGNVTINLTQGLHTGFNLVSNPYPAAVQLKNVQHVGVGEYLYLWQIDRGTRGGYTVHAITDDLVLPVGGAFFVEATQANAQLQFRESDKTTLPSGFALFQNNTAQPVRKMLFTLRSDKIVWDRWELHLQDTAKEIFTRADAPKLFNPDANFYSLTEDGKGVSIDKRPPSSASIPLVLRNALPGQYQLDIQTHELAKDTNWLFIDHFAKTTFRLLRDTIYRFQVTADTNTYGSKRFEMMNKRYYLPPRKEPHFIVYPGISQDGLVQIRLQADTAAEARIDIVNLQGMRVAAYSFGKTRRLEQTLRLRDLPKDQYIIRLHFGAITMVRRWIYR